jgi:hypothetical protein
MAKTLTDRKKARLLREARRFFDGFPIDWSQLGEPSIDIDPSATGYSTWPAVGTTVPSKHLKCVLNENDDAVLEIVWTHKENPEIKISLTSVWWEPCTGAILQAGSNYGRLAM